jgi:threonine synthase
MGMIGAGLLERYRDRLPVGPATPSLTLGEGSTPLVRSRVIGERLGVELYFKCEGINPTGSFKDRGMVVAVAKALEDGAEGIICASTGNTAASAAAYAACAGIRAVVLVPAGAIAAAKLAQARIAGARVLEVRGSFEQAFAGSIELSQRGLFVLANSVNPNRIEGQKTAAFELVEQLGAAPEVLALPYGGGGNTCAYAKGFDEEGAAPRLVCGEATDRAATLASAIRIVDPAHLSEIEQIVAHGRTEIVALRDDEITAAWLALARSEGIFCEPSSAAGLAALSHTTLERESTVVCVLTGHGLKDPAAIEGRVEAPISVEPTAEAILAAVRS